MQRWLLITNHLQHKFPDNPRDRRLGNSTCAQKTRVRRKDNVLHAKLLRDGARMKSASTAKRHKRVGGWINTLANCDRANGGGHGFVCNSNEFVQHFMQFHGRGFIFSC